MSYAAYLRKSRADAEAEARGESETLARHKTMLTALAARHGHTIEKWYPEVVSGESISARPEMQALLSDVGQGRWEGIYVMEVERLARGDTSDQGRVARTFMFSKTLIITPAKTYDPTNEFDEEYFEFSLFMSRREYKTINRRIQAGRMQSVREGKYICSRPAYGYRKVKIKNDKGYTLGIEPNEAAVVRQVFDWYLHGDNGHHMGYTRIANRLVDMHVPPGEQGGGWKPCRIQRMLTNEVYIGKIRWGHDYTSKELTEMGISKKRKLTKEYQLFDGLHEPIISEEDFEMAQRVMPTHATKLNKTRALSNPLAGLVVCSGCGHTLRGKPAAGRQPEMLFCATHGCSTVRTYRQPVEDAVLHGIRELLAKYQAQLDNAASGQPDATVDILKASITSLLEEQDTLSKQQSKLHDLLEREIYTPDIFAMRMKELTARSVALEKALAEAKASLSKLEQDAGKEAAKMIPRLRHVLDSYEATETAAEKNELLKSVIEKISYTKTVKGNQHVDANQFDIDIYPRII